MLDVTLFGVDPGAHHLVSLLLHTANALLLFLVLSRSTHTLWRSALVAALFALHPLHVESVAWVSERKDVLSGLFWWLTMLSYVSYANKPTPPRYLSVLVFFSLGLLSKPMLVTLPFALLLFDLWPLGRWARDRARIRRLLLEKLPLLLLATASCIVTLGVQQEAIWLPSTPTPRRSPPGIGSEPLFCSSPCLHWQLDRSPPDPGSPSAGAGSSARWSR
jgi:hypothetical protein